MKRSVLLLLAPALLASAADTPVKSSQTRQPTPPPRRAQANAAAAPGRILYKPPRVGAPKVTTGPGARGARQDQVVLAVLAPDHVGLTTSEQPVLHWYQSGPVDMVAEVTLVEPGKPEPMLEITWPRASADTIQHLDLARHGVRLEPGVEYRWSVAFVRDPEQRSQDIVGSGAIQRIAEPERLRSRLASARPADRPAIYAEEGIWYDAVSALAKQIDQAPQDAALLEDAAGLASQVGLAEVAAHYSSCRQPGAESP